MRLFFLSGRPFPELAMDVPGNHPDTCGGDFVPPQAYWVRKKRPGSAKEDGMPKIVCQFLLIASVTTSVLWAASDPLVGKWKLDPSKSKATDLMRVAAAGEGKYTLIFNSGDTETLAPDGMDHPGVFGTTVSITVLAPDHWTVVRKQDGHILLTGNWKLAADGKSLTDHFTSYKRDGTTATIDYVYLRSTAGSGFPGSWESQTDAVHESFELEIQPWEGDGYSLTNSYEGSPKNLKLDGMEYPRQGKYVPAGSTSSGRRTNDRTIDLTDKINGRITDTQQIEVSPDDKTLTVTMHPAGQSKPNILVFNRE